MNFHCYSFGSYVEGTQMETGILLYGQFPVTTRKTASISGIRRGRDSERAYCTQHFGDRLE